MSEILGHDVNGRPLRAGDRVEVVSVLYYEEFVGQLGVVVGPGRGAPGVIRISLRHPITGRHGCVRCEFVRRIDDRTDHQPSDFTFDSLMDHLKSGVPA